MPPPQLDGQARDRLLDAAEEQMLSRGFFATSVEGICAAAGLTKGSFFHYFASKEALGKVLLERFGARQEAAFVSASAAINDPYERVLATLDVALATVRDPSVKGCLIGTFAQELGEGHPELRQVCQTKFAGFAAWVAADLIAAKAAYCPEADFDAASLGGYLLSIVQGSLLLLKTFDDRAAMERNLRHFREYLRILYGR